MSDRPSLTDIALLLTAAMEAQSALEDYIPQLEAKGASLNYGKKVVRDLKEAIARFKP